MEVTPVTASTAAAATQAAAKVPTRVTPAVLQVAANDGDGLTGAAALNDGDAASQAARRAVDVRA